MTIALNKIKMQTMQYLKIKFKCFNILLTSVTELSVNPCERRGPRPWSLHVIIYGSVVRRVKLDFARETALKTV